MPFSNRSDEEILELIRTGDERAFEELLRRYYERLGQYASSILRSHSLADDAVWSVFNRIWRRRETLLINSSVERYLFGAVSNESISLGKTMARHPWIGLDQAPPSSLVDSVQVEESLLYRELHEEIETLLASLPPKRQLIFRLHRLEGLSYNEIAQQLGLSSRTVQNQMVQAAKQLMNGRARLLAKMEQKSVPGRNSEGSGSLRSASR